MKKLLSALLCISMMFSLSALSYAADEAEEYDIWVGAERITSENANDVLGDACVKYDLATDTLTLSDATINEYHQFDSSAAAVYSESELNIKLIGNNTVSVTKDASPVNSGNYGIFSNKSLNFFGGGSLTVTAPSYGIYAYTGLKIDGCAVTATAFYFAIYSVDGDLGLFNSSISAFASNKSGYGIGNFYGSITIENSDVFSVSNFGMVAQKGGKILITDSRVVCAGNNKAIYFLEDCLTLRTSYNQKMYIRSSADRLGIIGARVKSTQYDSLASKLSRFVYIDLRSSGNIENTFALLLSQIRVLKSIID